MHPSTCPRPPSLGAFLLRSHSGYSSVLGRRQCGSFCLLPFLLDLLPWGQVRASPLTASVASSVKWAHGTEKKIDSHAVQTHTFYTSGRTLTAAPEVGVSATPLPSGSTAAQGH